MRRFGEARVARTKNKHTAAIRFRTFRRDGSSFLSVSSFYRISSSAPLSGLKAEGFTFNLAQNQKNVSALTSRRDPDDRRLATGVRNAGVDQRRTRKRIPGDLEIPARELADR